MTSTLKPPGLSSAPAVIRADREARERLRQANEALGAAFSARADNDHRLPAYRALAQVVEACGPELRDLERWLELGRQSGAEP